MQIKTHFLCFWCKLYFDNRIQENPTYLFTPTFYVAINNTNVEGEIYNFKGGSNEQYIKVHIHANKGEGEENSTRRIIFRDTLRSRTGAYGTQRSFV